MKVENILSEFKQWILPIAHYRGVPYFSSTYWVFERWEYVYTFQDNMVFKHKTDHNLPLMYVSEDDLNHLISERRMFPAYYDNVRMGIYEQMEKK